MLKREKFLQKVNSRYKILNLLIFHISALYPFLLSDNAMLKCVAILSTLSHIPLCKKNLQNDQSEVLNIWSLSLLSHSFCKSLSWRLGNLFMSFIQHKQAYILAVYKRKHILHMMMKQHSPHNVQVDSNQSKGER